jgi:oligopeptide/dipeptide ABC transporter ATP-binding protein
MTARTQDLALLDVEGLEVTFGNGPRRVNAVRDVSFAIGKGEVVALVGESGSGKSTTSLTMLGLLAPDRASVRGRVRVRRKSGSEIDIVSAPERQLKKLRGNDVAMIFQEPMSSLNPIYTVGHQIAEALRVHRSASRQAAKQGALRLLTQMSVPSPENCLVSYPHQLSGGMRQRVMIAMALSGSPALLVADEPTTALDVTVQAQIVDILRGLQRQTGMAMLFVSHDLALVSEIAERVLVMYAGQIVEEGPIPHIFTRPRMPYTKALMRSRAKLGSRYRIEVIPGNVPNPSTLPTGCSFHPRCPHSLKGLCDIQPPQPEQAEPGWRVRCHRWRELEAVRT